MLKILLFILFSILQLSTCLSSCWFWDLVNADPLALPCDVEKDKNDILQSKKNCSNLIPVEGHSLYNIFGKTYLETINHTYIKQWTISEFDQTSVKFKIQNYDICKIVLAGIWSSKVEMIFASNFSFYHASWDLRFPVKYVKSVAYLKSQVTYLTDNFHTLITISKSYVMLFNYGNKTLTEKVYTKSEKKFTDFYVLKNFDKAIKRVDFYPPTNTTLTITLADNSLHYVEIIYPTSYISTNYYSNPGQKSYSYETNWLYVVIFFLVNSCIVIRICLKLTPKDDNTSSHTRLTADNEAFFSNVTTTRPPPRYAHANCTTAIPMPWKDNNF